LVLKKLRWLINAYIEIWYGHFCFLEKKDPSAMLRVTRIEIVSQFLLFVAGCWKKHY
jgi:hypothetical protein